LFNIASFNCRRSI